MGKFSERLSARLRRKRPADERSISEKWRSIGDCMGLAVEIVELDPDEITARLIEFRLKFGSDYEKRLRDNLDALEKAAAAQTQIATRARRLLDQCAKRVDEAMKPRLVLSATGAGRPHDPEACHRGRFRTDRGGGDGSDLTAANERRP